VHEYAIGATIFLHDSGTGTTWSTLHHHSPG
jgi:hypothetical protein